MTHKGKGGIWTWLKRYIVNIPLKDIRYIEIARDVISDIPGGPCFTQLTRVIIEFVDPKETE